MKFDFNWSVSVDSEEWLFKMVYLSDLGQRSNNDLDLWCPQSFRSQVYQFSLQKLL